MQANGETFDFVFGDLTDTPLDAGSSEAAKDTWKTLQYILGLGVQLIKPNTGKYLTHCNGKSMIKSISQYEHMLTNLSVHSEPDLGCTFTSSESFVPSFQEVWVLYQISMTTRNQ